MIHTIDHIHAAFCAAKRFDRMSPAGRRWLLVRVTTLACQVQNDPPLQMAARRLRRYLQALDQPYQRRLAPGRLWVEYDRNAGRWAEWERRRFWESWRRVRREATAAAEWETVVSLDALRDAIGRHEGNQADSEKARVLALAASLGLQ